MTYDVPTTPREARMAELLLATQDLCCAGRVACGANGRLDPERAYAIFDALHNVGIMHEGHRDGISRQRLGSLHAAFAALPADTYGRARMMRALEAYAPEGSLGRTVGGDGGEPAFPERMPRRVFTAWGAMRQAVGWVMGTGRPAIAR